MSKRDLSKKDRARLRGSKTYNNIVMYPGGELDELNEFMESMPDEMFSVLVNIVTDIANVRANSARDKVGEKITENVTEALGISDEDEQFTTVEDAVLSTVNDTFLKRFGDW